MCCIDRSDGVSCALMGQVCTNRLTWSGSLIAMGWVQLGECLSTAPSSTLTSVSDPSHADNDFDSGPASDSATVSECLVAPESAFESACGPDSPAAPPASKVAIQTLAHLEEEVKAYDT